MRRLSYLVVFALGFFISFLMVEPYFLPSESAVVVNALSNAFFSIDIVVFSLYPSQITEVIKQKAMDGVKVRIIVNKNTFDFRTAKELDEMENIEVRVYNGKVHSKFYIIDNYIVMVGSNNISKSALTKNKEAGVKLILIHVWDYIQEFNKIWDKSEPISSFS